jgi:uncharacterized membrane protein YfcA
MSIWIISVAGLLAVGVLSGLVPPTPALVGLIVLCFACELVDSSLGMGFGTTLVPVLLIAGYDPHQLVPTVLVSEFLSGFAAFCFHAEAGNVRPVRGSTHLHAASTLAFFSVVGVVAGVNLALGVPEIVLMRLVGLIIIAAGLVILIVGSRQIRFRYWKVALLGLVASFNKGISGGGYGPLMTSGQVLSGVDGKAAVSITSFAEGFTCLGGAILYLILGQPLEPALLVPVAAGSLLSVPISAQVIRVTHENLLRRVIGIFTLVMGLLTLGRSFVS